jgi:hypothetical protein
MLSSGLAEVLLLLMREGSVGPSSNAISAQRQISPERGADAPARAAWDGGLWQDISGPAKGCVECGCNDDETGDGQYWPPLGWLDDPDQDRDPKQHGRYSEYRRCDEFASI